MSLSPVPPLPTVMQVNGVEMPQIALGTWSMKGQEAARAVASALEIGYRYIDTTEAYENEDGVGEGLRASGVPRDQVFVTTKFQRQWHGRESVRTACEGNLRRLGLDYLDLLLVHWPNPQQGRFVDPYHLRPDPKALHRERGIVTEAWSKSQGGGGTKLHLIE